MTDAEPRALTDAELVAPKKGAEPMTIDEINTLVPLLHHHPHSKDQRLYATITALKSQREAVTEDRDSYRRTAKVWENESTRISALRQTAESRAFTAESALSTAHARVAALELALRKSVIVEYTGDDSDPCVMCLDCDGDWFQCEAEQHAPTCILASAAHGDAT